MALAIDSTSGGAGVQATSLTWAHTCTGSDLVLIVGVSVWENGGGPYTISGVTYNGDAMTLANDIGDKDKRAYIFYLVNPDTGGSYNIIATVAGGSSGIVSGGAVSITGASQTDPIGVTGGATSCSSDISTAVTTTVADSILIDVFNCSDNPQSHTAGAGQTRYEIRDGNKCMSGSYKATTTVGNYTMSWKLGYSSSNYVHNIVEVVSAISGPANIKTYKGLAAASVKTCKGLAIASVKTKKGLN